MYIDLHEACMSLESQTVVGRVHEFATKHKGTWVAAIGGFPIQLSPDSKQFLWCGLPASASRIRDELGRGLGLSAELTYMNRSKLSLDALGTMCADRGHDWGFHWMSLSIVFVGVPLETELAFARDTRFNLSWPVTQKFNKEWYEERVFMASASIKDWVKFAASRKDADFDAATRTAMQSAYRLLKAILPSTDKEQHWIVDHTAHRRVLQSIQSFLERSLIVEVGSGHGELTRLILKHGVARVDAFEIEPDLMAKDLKCVYVWEKDFTQVAFGDYANTLLIANPPYSILPFIRQFIDLTGIRHAMLLVPESILHEPGWGDFRAVAELPGTAFNPVSQGKHVIVLKGFE